MVGSVGIAGFVGMVGVVGMVVTGAPVGGIVGMVGAGCIVPGRMVGVPPPCWAETIDGIARADALIKSNDPVLIPISTPPFKVDCN